jgi:stage III sporulation protein AA
MVSNHKENRIRRILEEEILTGVSPKVRDIISKVPEKYIYSLEEIRIRLGKPVMIHCGNSDYMVTSSGALTERIEDAYNATKEDCEKTIQLLSNYSVYALEEEFKNGYITLAGGHRIGIAGRGVVENGRIKTLKNISGFNIRIARQVPGAADNVLKYVVRNGSDIYNTLIISPPQCGKTTLLRDIIRQLSNGISTYGLKGLKIGLVDERSEIAGSYQGIPQNDVGCRTDVLDACPKSMGLIMLIRSMSPQVVATDEIGSRADIEAIYEAMNAGIRLVTTIHGQGLEDILNRPFINEVIKNKVFDRLIILSTKYGPGTIEQIIDGTNFERLIQKPFR